MNRLLENLNEAQCKAVTTTEGPLLVIAGAGSGKTRVLTRRLAYLLTERLAEPHQLLAVTFTNKAAGEMNERVGQLMGGIAPGIQVSTFHSFCARLLRSNASLLGYTNSFSIFDSDDSRTLVKNCLKLLGFSEGQFPHRAQLRKISELKNQLVSAAAFAKRASGYFETRSSEIYSLYQKRLRECNAMDFDDLLFHTASLLKNNEELLARYQERFRYILVDEYQDTNHVQYLLLRMLADKHKNLCVVGDEDQSIYGWRGADIRNILDFEKDFPNAGIIKLEQNYRSTGMILRAASSVISRNEMRKKKTLRPVLEEGEKLEVLFVDNADEEATRVVERISRTSFQKNELAILYRTNAQSRAFEEQLRRQGIPYQVFGGVSFYARREIKEIVAYLRMLVNFTDDVSFGRVINYPRRGIGQKTLQQIADLARSKEVSRYEIVKECHSHPELSSKVAKLEVFRELIERYRVRAESESVDIVVQDMVDELKLIPELLNEDPITGQTRVENVEAFVEGVAQYASTHPEPRLSEYLQEISLYTDVESDNDTDDKVGLMTIHSAKGLEFDGVFMVGLEEGRFPLQRAILDPEELEEERRLFYVGLTRARKMVHISLATIRFQFGEVEAMPSRFISELPDDCITKKDMRRQRRMSYSAGQSQLQVKRTPVRAATPTNESYYEYEGQEMYKPGRVVAHPTFGRGKILNVEGFGDSLRLEIMFSGLGIKKIMARFAKLKVVG